MDFASAWLCRESDPDLVVLWDRQARVLVAALPSVLARMQRSLQRQGSMPEPPA
jgi:hypothetical protein